MVQHAPKSGMVMGLGGREILHMGCIAVDGRHHQGLVMPGRQGGQGGDLGQQDLSVGWLEQGSAVLDGNELAPRHFRGIGGAAAGLWAAQGSAEPGSQDVHGGNGKARPKGSPWLLVYPCRAGFRGGVFPQHLDRQ